MNSRMAALNRTKGETHAQEKNYGGHSSNRPFEIAGWRNRKACCYPPSLSKHVKDPTNTRRYYIRSPSLAD